jgi:hypothetical protein
LKERKKKPRRLLMGEDRGVHMVLVGKPEGKRPLGTPRRRWEDNIIIIIIFIY